MPVSLSSFARGLTAETAFDVLAVAKQAQGRRQGRDRAADRRQPVPEHAPARSQAGQAAIDAGADALLPVARPARVPRDDRQDGEAPSSASRATAENVVVAPGAKPFEQFFCEAFLEPGRRGARLPARTSRPTSRTSTAAARSRSIVPLRQENALPPRPRRTIERFVKTRAAGEGDLPQLAAQPDRRRRDEGRPRGHRRPRSRHATSRSSATSRTATWSGKGSTTACWPSRGCSTSASARTPSRKSYSMSGWRCGYAVAAPRFADVIGKMINTSLSCVPPFVQLAGKAALEHDAAERDDAMRKFHAEGRAARRRACGRCDGVTVLMPAGTFYVFPNVSSRSASGSASRRTAWRCTCSKAPTTRQGVACLGGECFGAAGAGLPALQLRRAGRAARRGGAVLRRRHHAHRPREQVPRRASKVSNLGHSLRE